MNAGTRSSGDSAHGSLTTPWPACEGDLLSDPGHDGARLPRWREAALGLGAAGTDPERRLPQTAPQTERLLTQGWKPYYSQFKGLTREKRFLRFHQTWSICHFLIRTSHWVGSSSWPASLPGMQSPAHCSPAHRGRREHVSPQPSPGTQRDTEVGQGKAQAEGVKGGTSPPRASSLLYRG